MKKLAFILIYLLVNVLPTSGSTHDGDTIRIPGRSAMSLQFHTGFLMAHRPSVVYLQRDHALAVELSWHFHPDRTTDWQSLYSFPNLAISYRYINFGNPEQLGTAHCIYPQLQLPLTNHNPFALQARIGFGLGLMTKTFDEEDNYKNLTISSHINAAVMFGLQARIFTNKKTQLVTGIDFFHISNGAAQMPNLGLNIPTLNVGIIHYNGAPEKVARTTRSAVLRKREAGIYYATGFNEKYPPGGNKYLVQVMNGFYQVTAGRKGVLGGGADFIYDTSLPAELKEEGKSGNYFKDATRIGLYGSAGLRVSKFDLLLQTGWYIHNNEKSDGNIYSRLALRYQFHKHFFAGMHLKTHFGRADYTEWTIGYKF